MADVAARRGDRSIAPPAQRFVTLDAMRGVAALFVVWRHFSDGSAVAGELRFSFLAVDLFFVLSGFVLSYRHDARDDGLSLGGFFARRLLRLLPLYLVGVALASRVLYFHALYGQLSWPRALVSLALASMMLPSPSWPGYWVAFPVMVPAWSLFFELWVANLMLGLLRNRLSDRMLISGVVVAGVAYIVSAYHWGTFELGMNWVGFVGGFPRVIFSFGLGMLLQRGHARGHLRWHLPSWLLLVALGLLLGQRGRGPFAEFVVALAIFAIVPAFVSLGANAPARVPWLGTLLGDTSYAIYVLHSPVLGFLRNLEHSGRLPINFGVELTLLVGLVIGSYLMATFYDEPVRRWIGRRMFRARRLRV